MTPLGKEIAAVKEASVDSLRGGAAKGAIRAQVGERKLLRDRAAGPAGS